MTELHVSVSQGGGWGVMTKNCGNALLPPSPFGGFGWSCGCLLDDQSAASLMSLSLRALHSIQNFHDLLFDDFSGVTGVWN